jgi:hypothetical protein
MEKFRRRPAVLPVNLYRVQYPGCQTALSGNGLEAKDTNVTYTEDGMNAFRQSIIEQLTWGHRGAQPYITCFSDKDHAENWALKEPWNPGEREKDSWSLLTINTRSMPETYVFSLNDLVTQLDLALPERVSQHVRGAYLCLHRIPTTAIVSSASPREVKDGTQVAVLT